MERDRAALPSGDFAQVRFEDLERDPRREIERVYAELSLKASGAFLSKLARYLEQEAGYQKNRFAQLPEEQRAAVDAAMRPYMRAWGYDAAKPQAA